MNQPRRNLPYGIRCLKYIFHGCCEDRRINFIMWQTGVLALTYLAYTSYHMTRKPISVVKHTLSLNCSGLPIPPNITINDTNRDTWCDWAPFNTEDAPALLGMLDSAFLFAYAIAMFISGFIAERINLRYFLSLGMFLSGISCYLFGIARPYNIHSLWYFILIQVLGGIFQTSGWPGVVTIVGNWFGKSKRGLIFGIWNSHTSLGNILGTLVAAVYVETDWSLSFMLPGIIMGVLGFINFLLLVPNPMDAGYSIPTADGYQKISGANSSDEESADVGYHSQSTVADDLESGPSETTPILSGQQRIYNVTESNAIGFIGALKIPGVMEYAMSLFFAKLVSYTFLYWLPLYIASSTTYTSTVSADLSTLFDAGGILGAIVAGVLSDYTGMSASTCAGMFILAIPSLFLYDYVGNANLGVSIVLLLLVGILVNGPYALITTAVSAELGTHSSLGDNSKALATVAAIIDGTGSIGAAVGPLLAGLVSEWSGWHNVFYMLMYANLMALLFLSRLVDKEIKAYRQRRRGVIHI